MLMKARLFFAVMVLVLVTIFTFTGGVFSQEYTGLIIDATGLKADVVLYPEILTIDLLD